LKYFSLTNDIGSDQVKKLPASAERVYENSFKSFDSFYTIILYHFNYIISNHLIQKLGDYNQSMDSF
jgi:hypothetical protein